MRIKLDANFTMSEFDQAMLPDLIIGQLAERALDATRTLYDFEEAAARWCDYVERTGDGEVLAFVDFGGLPDCVGRYVVSVGSDEDWR